MKQKIIIICVFAFIILLFIIQYNNNALLKQEYTKLCIENKKLQKEKNDLLNKNLKKNK